MEQDTAGSVFFAGFPFTEYVISHRQSSKARDLYDLTGVVLWRYKGKCFNYERESSLQVLQLKAGVS